MIILGQFSLFFSTLIHFVTTFRTACLIGSSYKKSQDTILWRIKLPKLSSDKPPVYSCVSAYKFILFQAENLENYFHVISLNHVNIISRLEKGQLVLLADYTHKLTSSGRLFDMCKQSCFQDRSFVQCEFIFYFTFCRKSENVKCCDNEYIWYRHPCHKKELGFLHFFFFCHKK